VLTKPKAQVLPSNEIPQSPSASISLEPSTPSGSEPSKTVPSPSGPIDASNSESKTPEAPAASPVSSTRPAEAVPEEPKEIIPQDSPVQKTRTAVLYFVRISDDGTISSQKVKRVIPISDSPLQDTLEQLLKGPTEAEIRANLISLIPSDTQLRSINVRGSTVIVDFNDAFAYNRYGKEGYLAQLRQVVFTMTEFPSISDVQFLIQGQVRPFLTEGVPLDSPWSRARF